jgi:dTDP-4-dehydrorhamnose reductase
LKVLITGGKGQLGSELETVLRKDGQAEVVCLPKDVLDVTKAEETQRVLSIFKPCVIIHAAANTNVDNCEIDQDRAYQVNALGTRNVAVAASRLDAKLVYISTDYVFNGGSAKPYTEFDKPDPINVYGRTKLAGEQFTTSLSNKYFIVRTSWLYGRQGKNFIKTMLSLAGEKTEVAVVCDQTGSPTYAKDLAFFLMELIQTELYGIYHYSNSGFCSWFDFAKKIFEMAGLKHVLLRPVSTKEFKRPAPRPAYSVLDHYRLRLEGMTVPRYWEDALREFMKETGLTV